MTFYKIKLMLVYVLYIVISSIFILICVECLLRIVGKNKTIAASIQNIISDNNNKQESNSQLYEYDASIQGNTFNIYYFGESTMEGMPYGNTIPVLVEKMTGSMIDGKKLRWVNLGRSGINISEVKNRIEQMITHSDVTYPSLVILYSGHNEFLQYHNGVGFTFRKKNHPQFFSWIVSHSELGNMIAKAFKYYKLEIDDRKYFDVPLFTIDNYLKIISEYTLQLSDIISLLKEKNIPVIISTQVANYSYFEPNRSVYCQNESNKTQYEQLTNQGDVFRINGNNENALQKYDQALLLCDSFAETYYHMGEVYLKLGQTEKAWSSFRKSVDLDRMPIRAVSIQNDFIRKQDDNKTVHIVDAENYLRLNSNDDNIGYNLMIDGHHPNLNGYILISELIAKKIKDLYPDNISMNKISDSEAQGLFIPSDKDYFRIYLLEAEWLMRIATWRYDPLKRLDNAEDYIHQVLEKDPANARAYMELMTIMYLRNNKKSALQYYNKAMSMDKKAVDEWYQNPWVQEIIARAEN